MADDSEKWDDDLDLQGDLFTHSVSTVHTNLSSRLSLRSESNAADEDWNILLAPNDDASTSSAIQSAKQAGIPIPQNVPSSALMGGTIKRLGKANIHLKLKANTGDDWTDDLDIPQAAPLSLKKPHRAPSLSAFGEDDEGDGFGEDFDDFTDSSLGIRFAGTRRDTRNRSSSASAMSPSLGSATNESEDDDFRGLELPAGPIDLNALLQKRQAAEAAAIAAAAAAADAALATPTAKAEPVPEPVTQIKIEQPTAKKTQVIPAILSDENDDFLLDLDIGGGEIFDPKKRTLNRNIKQKSTKPVVPAPARAPMTTLTFSDKPTAGATTRIPRLAGTTKNSSRLEPVFESGATQVTRQRQQPTSSGASFLRSKRSMPVLRGSYHTGNPKPHVPFLPVGPSSSQSQHVTSKPPSYASAYHLRQNSDPHRSQSPVRSYSRLSSGYVPDTPSRNARRAELAPSALAREAAAKRTVTKPTKRRNFGDGSELDLFDDLPTSTLKESKFLKQPSSKTAPKSLRNIPSKLDTYGQTKLPLPERMTTPAPETPRSPARGFQEQSNIPHYLRDTAASRIARETRLRNAPNVRPRSSETGPTMPAPTNWKAQVAARSPHSSPTAQRNKSKRITPTFIPPNAAQTGKSMTEKGMVFNPHTLRWEGNENSLASFDFPQPLQTPTMASHARASSYFSHFGEPSPPRPALITPLASDYSNQNIKVVGGMVFDPRRMCWLKLRPGEGGKNSPSVAEDEEDPFAAIEDLKDEPAGPSGATSGLPTPSGGVASDGWLVGEEFDLGPDFIRRQRDEEISWRRKCEAWFPAECTPRYEGDEWRWVIRDIAGQML